MLTPLVVALMTVLALFKVVLKLIGVETSVPILAKPLRTLIVLAPNPVPLPLLVLAVFLKVLVSPVALPVLPAKVLRGPVTVLPATILQVTVGETVETVQGDVYSLPLLKSDSKVPRIASAAVPILS
ncbi:jg27515 [Pararge aegeria aegeria]|uniref:Jg27515 protein n=1 Tax=Pararge aegeria aegeria TaxID=348720 RepID=A0A8S4SFB7_9NEOP|nr:jg27515 [Pararge aegeria aegeria]